MFLNKPNKFLDALVTAVMSFFFGNLNFEIEEAEKKSKNYKIILDIFGNRTTEDRLITVIDNRLFAGSDGEEGRESLIAAQVKFAIQSSLLPFSKEYVLIYDRRMSDGEYTLETHLGEVLESEVQTVTTNKNLLLAPPTNVLPFFNPRIHLIRGLTDVGSFDEDLLDYESKCN